MKVNGSVLIVVLGLLAILAVVGVAFVTMSSIDRSTAANFAANTQLMMAADSGVDYAAHYLVNDVWQLTGSGTTKKHLLLTNTTGFESFDAPGTDDPWLTEPITGPSTNPAVVSFSGTTVPAYGINFNSKSAAGWDNLGSGGTNGVFLTDLAFPYESRIVRVSVTILDHGGLINLNAHGNQAWPDAVRGVGYYVSDVNPACAALRSRISPTSSSTGAPSAAGGPPAACPTSPNSAKPPSRTPSSAAPSTTPSPSTRSSNSGASSRTPSSPATAPAPSPSPASRSWGRTATP